MARKPLSTVELLAPLLLDDSSNRVYVKYPNGTTAFMQKTKEGMRHTGDARFLALSDGTGVFYPTKKVVRKTFHQLRQTA